MATLGRSPGAAPLTSADIPDDSITGAKIVDDAIDSEHYAAGSVDAAHVAADVATQAELDAIPTYNDNVIQTNIALLAFKASTNGSLVKYNLQDQVIDEYIDATGVNAGDSTNENLTVGVYSGGQSNIHTGGLIETGQSGYRVHVFGDSTVPSVNGSSTADGPFVVNAPITADILIIAGGGGGAAGPDHLGNGGSGGGAGGMLVLPNQTLAAGTYVVTVGGGGAGGAYNAGGHVNVANSEIGRTGVNSTVICAATGYSKKAYGGGHGSNEDHGTLYLSQHGGSGGGTNSTIHHDQGRGVYPDSIFKDEQRQGYDGSLSIVSSTSGGGGGAGETDSGGLGGDGASNVYRTGSGITYAGGGGGAAYLAGGSAGGSGGGGAGNSSGNGVSGTNKLGGGGGGGQDNTAGHGGDGGSGIVIIRYLYSAAADLILQSSDTTAETAPTKADIIMLVEDAGSGIASLNTGTNGLQAYISMYETGGTKTWTQATLVDEGHWGTTDKRILAAHDVTLTGTSGTQMAYKITTHNASTTYDTKIHATSIGWR